MGSYSTTNKNTLKMSVLKDLTEEEQNAINECYTILSKHERLKDLKVGCPIPPKTPGN
jgi:hypothetical protein